MKLRAIILFVLSFSLYCCGPYTKNAAVVGAPGTLAPPAPQEYRMTPGDKISIKLFYNPDLNQEVTVRPDGKIALMLVHDVNAAGITPSELTQQLTESYGKFLQQPEVAVIVSAFAGQRVFVGGEVAQPGVKDIIGPTTVIQAIAMAGGFKDDARLNEVVVMRRDENGKPFIIKLDSVKATRGIDLQQDIYVQAYDMIVVPRSNIGDVDLWVLQYIHNTVGILGQDALGFYYFSQGANGGVVR